MKLFGRVPNFNFMGRRKPAMVLSSLLILASLGWIPVVGMNLGIDFTGGLLLIVEYPEEAPLQDIRETLSDAGFEAPIVQNFGASNEVMIRLPPVDSPEDSGEVSGGRQPNADDVVGVAFDRALAALRDENPEVEQIRRAFVDSQVGDDLTDQGSLAMLFALILIFMYVMLRFRWKFAAGAIAALVHDVILTIGIYAMLGLSFDLTVLAAVLAVVGYSLNDTIVVFDRIRENFRLMRRGTAEEIVNASINQTLARTLITGITTLLVLLALYFLGGEAVFGFSVALIIGIFVGTYSSIYVASACALWLDVSPTDLIPPKREEIDDMP